MAVRIMDELSEVCELQTENEKLLRENRKLNRELDRMKALIERNRIASAAKDSLSRIISEKRSELERYMNLMLVSCPDIILLFNSDNKIVYCTDSFLQRCKIPAFGMIAGKTYRELLEPYCNNVFLEKMDTVFQQIQENKVIIELSEKIKFADNLNARNYSIQISPMQDEASAAGSMAFFYDATELLTAQYEAERANAAKSDFLATISHEIRTPMNAIMGVSRMLKSTSLTETQKEYLTNIQTSSESLLNLINDILDFSKIESGKFELIKDYFNFAEMLYNIESMFKLMFMQKELYFNCYFDKNLPSVVYGDDKRIRQVLINVLNNALKYTESGGVNFNVTLEADNNVRFEIEDTGIGIREESIPRLFSAFEQLDVVRNKRVVGTGLGLAITKSLCDLMNGVISVKSKYGKGSVFTVVLPMQVGTNADLPQRLAMKIDFVAPQARVLVVDDIELNLQIAEFMLGAFEIKADLATSGYMALELVEQNEYDLIFMDHMMPEMNGVEATKAIRSLGGHNKTVPIVALTANAVSSAVEMFMKNGFTGFISKPIDNAVLATSLLKSLPPNLVIEKQ